MTPQIFVPLPRTLKLRKNARNVTKDCHGYGKPSPVVKWKKEGQIIPIRTLIEGKDSAMIVQVVFNQSGASGLNITSRLYLHTDGATYGEAGTYTCEVYNGVNGNYTLNETIEILCKFTVMYELTKLS